MTPTPLLRSPASSMGVGDPDPSIEVTDVLCGYQGSRFRGRDRRLAALTPNRSGTSDLESPINLGLGPPISDPDSSTEVVGILCGYR
ncbi:hypothetical protein CDL15_Pgr022182 [Punica granatum]|uniref:Uncharacterized protein n=1 Tax=Punica granatum TaxID=22663 RepID=A0A218VSB0_PUNGR|nr:hypothetical protein CDL15_Pgr022182 [Punica granatum]PKI72489.1 hypothetical protein CRG98_007092 [Punica granatum]